MKKAALHNILLLSGFALLALGGCKGIDLSNVKSPGVIDENTLFVNDHKVECSAFSLRLCFQVRNSTRDSWQSYEGDIKGFTYQWGYQYELTVDTITIDPPPLDAPDKEYTFKKEVSKVQVSDLTVFDLTISRAKTADLIKKVNSDTYRVYDEKNLQCATTSQCDTIESLITQDSAILFKVRHDANPSNPLRLSEIKCSSSRESFKSSCLDN